MTEVTQQPLAHPPPSWLNRNVVGMGLTSLLADVSHEMVTAILPSFLAVLGVSVAALGAIEGIADSVSSFSKLGSGWISDRLGHRKPMAVGGYFLTGASTGLFALAFGWPLVLIGRTVGWFGRGVRGPLRNALLMESVPIEARGRAFGFERAGDTVGAIIGPLLAVGLLAYLHAHGGSSSSPFRVVFLLALIPGIGSGIVFATLVSERRHLPSRASFWLSLKALPNRFRRFLYGAGVFGMGDFARTLMILAAAQLLTPTLGASHAAEVAGLLYAGHNVLYAAASYPVGALSDRMGRRGLLALGYVMGALSAFGFLIAFLQGIGTVTYLFLPFSLAGISIAVVEPLEGALTADLAGQDLRGTAYGVLGTVNGIGDLVASVLVGTLWAAVSPPWAFGCAAVLMGLGGLILYRFR